MKKLFICVNVKMRCSAMSVLVAYALSPRILLASWISLGMIVTRLA